MNTLILFLDVYSRVCLPSVSPLCSTCPTRTRWISPHSETFRDFMLHSNCKWSTEPHGRYAELNLPIYNSPSNFFSVFDWCFDAQPLCLFFHRFSVCRSCRVQTWLWTRCEAVTRASVSRTFSMVRMLEYCIVVGTEGLMMIFFLTLRPLSVFLQIQPRAKWWGSHTWWWNTNWDCCERYCRTHSSHFDYYYLFVYSGLKKEQNKNYVQCFTCMIPV